MVSTDAGLTLSAERTVPWRDEVPAGFTPLHVHFGRDSSGVGEVQVAVARAITRPSKGVLEAMFKARAANTTMPVLVVAAHPEGVWLYEGRHQSLGPISLAQATAFCQGVLDEVDGLAAQQRIDFLWRSAESGGPTGYRNNYLFATHHLKVNVPKRQDWREACDRASGVATKRGKSLIEALGFTTEPVTGTGEGALLLRSASKSRRAIAVLLDESEHFDQVSLKNRMSPVAHGLQLAGEAEVPWVVVMRQSTLRLYPGRDGVGIGQRGQSDTYFELDLAMVDPEAMGLLTLIFSADALEKGGSADEILEGSARFAADLGARLRERVYDHVVPQVSRGIADRLPQLGLSLDAAGLKVAYALTLRVLFRVLFQAYAEDSGLLPAGRNKQYDANSLRAFTDRAVQTEEGAYNSAAASVWYDLVQVWDAIFHGNRLWDVPAYGGDLFDPTTPEGVLLKKLELPDSVLGPALRGMLTEITEDGVRGAVDFRSLQVREFGTIYEGLLESSLSLADVDLTLDSSGAFRPAKPGEDVVAPGGTAYFHSAAGDRKATGSYYTPKIVVDHLMQRSVEPALKRHLERVRVMVDEGKERAAADLFWDFRVGDLAMGSGHFLVAAVDKIEQGMRDFLTVCPLPSVEAELARLAQKARDALGDDAVAASQVNNAQLLRRQIARRSIYGLDINPLAVELARLAVWIHTFVPGLPMSSLSHGLVLGNSLTGVGSIDEALDALEPKRAPGQGTFFDDIIHDQLADARARLQDFAAADEADKAEVAAGATLLAEARAASATARRIFDAAVAVRIGEVPQRAVITEAALTDLLAHPSIEPAVERLSPAHMPVLFPEVFLRENPGFDVMVGNPPWEKVKVEEHQWWGVRIPGLRSMAQAQKNQVLSEFRAQRPDLEREYLAEVEATDALRAVLVKGPYPGLGSGGDPDLYQAFAWRFWTLLRDGGRAANVLPRGALSGSGLAAWRREILERGSFADVCFLMNRSNWIFEGVDGRYTVGLTVVQRGGDRAVRFCGPFASQDEFVEGRDAVAKVESQEFLEWSSSAAFPLIPDPKSAEVFRQMKRSPRFDEARPDWEFRPYRELDASLDKDKFEFDIDEPRGRIPVLAGASFNLWDPDFGTPYAYGKPEVLRQALADKFARASGNKRSAYFGMHMGTGELPMDRARIAFRDITRATDSRTALVCLTPPGSALVHNAPILVRRKGSARAEAFLLGTMSSTLFDWASRRWVELHLTFEVLGPLPVPRFDELSPWCSRVVEVSGRLAAVDKRYREWAAEVGVDVGTAKDPAVKDDLIAELDALVSLLYGLSEEQVKHVFATFHRGWDYTARLAAVLEHFRKWQVAA